jgi:long-chain acyl-CoA synthetase
LFFWAIEVSEPYGANGLWYEMQLKLLEIILANGKKDWVNLDLMVSGSAALQPRLAQFCCQIPVMEGYGLTKLHRYISK